MYKIAYKTKSLLLIIITSIVATSCSPCGKTQAIQQAADQGQNLSSKQTQNFDATKTSTEEDRQKQFLKEYEDFVVDVASKNYSEVKGRIDDNMIVLARAAIGLSAESGEIATTIQKSLFYGKKIDTVNLAEELGDILWYTTSMAKQLGYSIQDIAEGNMLKLKKRYPNKYSNESAINRNPKAERAILEAKFNKKQKKQ
jgi:NTP pyrophosphatase (non-canonical NTP hydrolase)